MGGKKRCLFGLLKNQVYYLASLLSEVLHLINFNICFLLYI